MLLFPARCATQPELFFRVSPLPMVPKSQLNFLPCQIKVNLRKPLCVQSERVRSRLDSPFFWAERERVGSGCIITLRIKGWSVARSYFPSAVRHTAVICATLRLLSWLLLLLLLQGRQPLARDHSHLQPSSGGHLHIPHPTADHAGVYICTATSPVGYASREVQLSVNSKEKVTDGQSEDLKGALSILANSPIGVIPIVTQ